MKFTQEERFLMLLYNPGTRKGLINRLRDMKLLLAPDEMALATLTDRVLTKLIKLTDEEFARIDLFAGLE